MCAHFRVIIQTERENFNRENFNHAIPKLSSRRREEEKEELSQSRNEEKELLSRRHDKAILLALDTWATAGLHLGFFEVLRSKREVRDITEIPEYRICLIKENVTRPLFYHVKRRTADLISSVSSAICEGAISFSILRAFSVHDLIIKKSVKDLLKIYYTSIKQDLVFFVGDVEIFK